MAHRDFILHQVLFTLKDGVDWSSELARQAEKATQNHPLMIPQIKAWCCGRSKVSRRQAVDFSLVGYFLCQKDLDAYMIHPDHQKGVALWKDISTWVVSDITINGDELVKLCMTEEAS